MVNNLVPVEFRRIEPIEAQMRIDKMAIVY